MFWSLMGRFANGCASTDRLVSQYTRSTPPTSAASTSEDLARNARIHLFFESRVANRSFNRQVD